MSEQRQATITWDDPITGASAALTMSGLDYITALKAGKYPPPPIARLFQMDMIEVAEGWVVFTAQPVEYTYNPIGMVHGGYATTVMDGAMGCAVHTTLPQGMAYGTTQINSHLVRAITLQVGILRCEAKVLHSGKQIATAEAYLRDENGKLYAHGTSTCAIFPIQKG